jgi:hypothetical protein
VASPPASEMAFAGSDSILKSGLSPKLCAGFLSSLDSSHLCFATESRFPRSNDVLTMVTSRFLEALDTSNEEMDVDQRVPVPPVSSLPKKTEPPAVESPSVTEEASKQKTESNGIRTPKNAEKGEGTKQGAEDVSIGNQEKEIQVQADGTSEDQTGQIQTKTPSAPPEEAETIEEPGAVEAALEHTREIDAYLAETKVYESDASFVENNANVSVLPRIAEEGVAVPRRASMAPRLRFYLAAAGLEDVENIDCKGALVALLGKHNFDRLTFVEDWETALLDCVVRLEKSTVRFDLDNPMLSITGAELMLVIPEALESQLDNPLRLNRNARVELSWSQANELALELVGTSVEGSESVTTKALKDALRTSTLEAAKELFSDNEEEALDLAQVMAVVLDTDQAQNLAIPLSPPFNRVDGSQLYPNLAKSEIQCLLDQGGKLIVESASICCFLVTESEKRQFNFSIGRTRVICREIWFQIDRRQNERLALQASGIVRNDDTNMQVDFELETDFDAQSNPTVTLSLPDVKSLIELATLLSWPDGILNLESPLGKQRVADLGELDGVMLSLRADAAVPGGFQVSKILTSIPSVDLQEASLPFGEDDEFGASGIEVTIIEPFDEERRQIAIVVRFLLDVIDEQDPIAIELHAQLTSGGYEYRIVMRDESRVLAILDVANEFGLEALTDFVSKASILKDVVQNLRVPFFSAQLVRKEKAFQLADWTMNLEIESLALIPGHLTAKNVSLSIQHKGEEDAICTGQGEVHVSISGKEFSLPLKIPTLCSSRVPSLEPFALVPPSQNAVVLERRSKYTTTSIRAIANWARSHCQPW